MAYNPAIHHRRSIRLKGYNYSQAGLYFITLCTQNRVHFFGNITNGTMNLNHAGVMIEKWYYELENKYPDKRCHQMVVMPNHFHCIIENISMSNDENAHDERAQPQPHYGINNKKTNATIGNAMDWFKTMTTNEYIRGVKQLGWQRFNGKLWQCNYYEHIIRDEKAYINISEYIKNNPAKWEIDTLK